MSEFDNTNRILDVTGSLEPKIDDVLNSNNEKEQEKNDIEENEIKENSSKIISDEKDINKSQKEDEIVKNEGTQKNEEDLLNNSMEKEENKSKEKDSNHIKDENNLNANEINNVNITKMLNIILKAVNLVGKFINTLLTTQ